MKITTFRKKPVEIQAVQWPGGPETATPIIDWILTGELAARWSEAHDGGPYPPEPEHISIDTLEGTMKAKPGDWIIRGVKGEFYPCKPDIFEATYEAVSGGVDPLAAAIQEATANPGRMVSIEDQQ